eukprot:1315655-Amorphochlora_amoeboformis.AAC.1
MSSEAKAVLASWAADKVKALEFGIRVALDEWQILTLAVEHRWGGQDSKLRAQYLYEDLCDWFTKAKQTIKCHQVYLKTPMELPFLGCGEFDDLSRTNSS